MPTAFDVSETMPVPADAAWSALIDWPSAPRWMPGVERLEGPAEPALGAELRLETVRGARRSVISALTPGRMVELTSETGPVTAVYRYEVSGGERATVRLVADVAATGPLRLLGPVIRRSVRRADGDQLRRLAAVLA
ncbi:MAG: SRPBCC family protein [Actinomycetota bacterium]